MQGKPWGNEEDEEIFNTCHETVLGEKKQTEKQTEKVKALRRKKRRKKPFFPQETSINIAFSLRTFLYLSLEITAVSGNASEGWALVG